MLAPEHLVNSRVRLPLAMGYPQSVGDATLVTRSSVATDDYGGIMHVVGLAKPRSVGDI
jgi:hypothetical protein